MEYLAILYSVGGGIPFAVVEFIRYPVVSHSLIKKDLTSDQVSSYASCPPLGTAWPAALHCPLSVY